MDASVPYPGELETIDGRGLSFEELLSLVLRGLQEHPPRSFGGLPNLTVRDLANSAVTFLVRASREVAERLRNDPQVPTWRVIVVVSDDP